MKRILTSVIVLMIALLCAVALFGCNKNGEGETSQTTAESSVQTTETESAVTSDTESKTTIETAEEETGLRPGADSPDGWDEMIPA